MDYYSFNSEVIESLNLLRPPVRRGPVNSSRDFSVSNYCAKNNFESVRGFGHSRAAKRINSCKRTSREDSSTSLILKKTSETQIFKQYSVLNTSLHSQKLSSLQKRTQQIDTSCAKTQQKQKPLIQVTVIPKRDQNRGKLFRKQRIVTNTVQSTASYHENSIQTKNVYLVVAGRKKEKIYEIKTTGSEKFEKESIGDEALDLCNFKHFINNLNMERKRKKDKKKDSKSDNVIETQVDNSDTYNQSVCKCMPEGVHEVSPGKSRVRIFGRIGLTEDDKYILKCQATVDDKPVPTSPTTVEKQLSSSSIAAYSRNGAAPRENLREDAREDIRSQRDSTMQTDFCNNAVNELLINIDNKNKIRKDSQSTQVNFNKPSGNSMNKNCPFRTSEQVTRCNCNSNGYPVIKTVNNGYDGKNLKPCQSPLVIISVFPKQENKLDFTKTLHCGQVDSKRPTSPENVLTINTECTNELTETKNIKQSARSRSPSPKGQKGKSKLKQTVEARLMKTDARSVSPPRSKLGKKESKKGTVTKSSKQTLQFFNSNRKKEVADIKRKSSPTRSPRVKTPPATPKTKEPQKKNASRQCPKPKATSLNEKADKGTNTEHLITKKALVDTYNKKITEQMKPNKDQPVKSLSTVSVTIDSENEYYDVFFCKDKFTTDLKVRKTMKEASSQKTLEENLQHGSMENFLTNISKRHKRSNVCRRSNCDKLNQSDDIKYSVPEFSVRDSLEIGHRREDKDTKKTEIDSRLDRADLTVNSADMEFLAPIKHYTGDDCKICDPVERDREIRELLGVRGRRNRTRFMDPQSQEFEMGDRISRHCFYSKQCDNTFVTAFALKNMCECIEDEIRNDIVNNNDSEHEMLLTQRNWKSKLDSKLKTLRGTVNKCICIHATKKPNSKSKAEFKNVSCPCNDKNAKIGILPTCEKNNQTQTEIKETELADQNNKDSTESLEQTDPKETDPEQYIANSSNETNADRNITESALNPYELPNLEQTSLFQQLTLNRNIQIFLQVEQFAKQKPIVLSKKQYNKIKKTIQHTVGKGKRCNCNRSAVSVGPKFGKKTHEVFVYANREVQTDTPRREISIKEGNKHAKSYKSPSGKVKLPVDTVVLFSNETRGSCRVPKPPNVVAKRAASSLEIRNASVAYWKHVTFSSTNVASIGSSSFAKRNRNSIETIFRGHKKSHTPNLGTSAFSLLSEAHISESQSMKLCSPDKAKRPFLKRLMSCLVLRSKTSEKIGPGPISNPPSVNSSVDSYHISTSRAIDMTSSMYDTSISFYSNHSIHPLSSKLKRSFFSSVKSFLTSRKS